MRTHRILYRQPRDRKPRLPLAPLLDQYRAGGFAPLLTSDAKTAQTAPDWLTPTFLDSADDATLCERATAFLRAVCPIVWHDGVIGRHVRFLRHAFNHLVRGHDPLPGRLTRCVNPGAIYAIAGLGPAFWAAVLKALAPNRYPLWCPATEAGLSRLGLLPESPSTGDRRIAHLFHGYDAVRAAAPDLTGEQLDDFLLRVGRMTNRELSTNSLPPDSWSVSPERLEHAIRTVRVKLPLRKRLREAATATAADVGRFQAAANECDWLAAWEAFRSAFPDPRWERHLSRLDDAYSPALPLTDRARLWCETAGVLRERFRVHPLELADVVLAATEADEEPPESAFGGFCADTFRFLEELASADSKAWMAARRERYEFVLREPLVELCTALAGRYVRPVLGGEYGWELEADTRPGRALTSICKNDFGRSGPYQSVQWITFYRQALANRRADAQFFVRVAVDGVRFGFHLGRSAREAGKQFRHTLQEHAEAIHAALASGGVFEECRFWTSDELTDELAVRTPADLRRWATHKTIGIGKHLPPDSPLLRADELVGEVLMTFDRLVPAFACAAEVDPVPLLARRAGAPADGPAYDRDAFTRDTFLSALWLDRVTGLLRFKKQVIFQGVPGTGKTHVARCLARWLACDRAECVRLVQFHPSYSYEEFVEGIRVRNVEVNGRSEVAYPVEDGVLAEFAAQASRRPSEPHVLVIDEINRGNLPRIFGELLYLLEYRDQAATLPYSKRLFRLPDNLYVLATMNAADRSAVALDQALRRRFSFVDLPPDAALLAHWFERNPPTDPDETFGPQVVLWFEELNRRLTRDLGPDRQIGHSFLMVPELDTSKLAAVWEHHIRPLLLDHLGGRVDRLANYDPVRFLGDRPHKRKPHGEPIGEAP